MVKKKSTATLRKEAIEIIKRGADVSNFGDPAEWQKASREEREIDSEDK